MHLEAPHTDNSAEYIKAHDLSQKVVKIGEKCSKDISLQNVTPAFHQMPLGFLVSRTR